MVSPCGKLHGVWCYVEQQRGGEGWVCVGEVVILDKVVREGSRRRGHLRPKGGRGLL